MKCHLPNVIILAISQNFMQILKEMKKKKKISVLRNWQIYNEWIFPYLAKTCSLGKKFSKLAGFVTQLTRKTKNYRIFIFKASKQVASKFESSL